MQRLSAAPTGRAGEMQKQRLRVGLYVLALLAALGSANAVAPGDAASNRAAKRNATISLLNEPRSADDISKDGGCRQEVATYCKDVPAGGARLADCITARLKAEKVANELQSLQVSKVCKLELRAFKIEMYRDTELDKKLVDACKNEISSSCDDNSLYPGPGDILACLRAIKDSVTEACKEQIFQAQLDAATDFKLDPQLDELCSPDAKKLCKDIPYGEARIQTCLREHRTKLDWNCRDALFRQEQENADDIRLDVRLFRACLNDKRKFCNDVTPGDARVKDCLESHRLDPDFTTSCKTEFDRMMERRASDFRLDPTLSKYCASDIEMCNFDKEQSGEENWDAKVIQCLQDFREELRDPKCRQQVHRLTKRAAEDMRFDRPLAEVCQADRKKHCSNVPFGMAQVLRCLQDHREELQPLCKSSMFDQEVRLAEDIDFHFPMKQACSAEIKNLCKDVVQGHAAIIKCLQEKVEETEMGTECKEEVKRNELRSAQDYRLMYRLSKACYSDVQKLCLHACDKTSVSDTCSGKVLKCLTENMENLTSDSCKKEVFSFEKLEVADVRLDVPLQLACEDDLAKMCRETSKDHGNSLSCLRSHRDNLSDECRAEELRFSMMEASDLRLTPTLMNACGQEIQTFCRDVSPADSQAFKCLQANLEAVGMSAACKGEVNLQEARRASNYKLDVSLRKACEADATDHCLGVEKGQEGHAPVLRCFVQKFKELSGRCQTEVSYAVRMALWQYKKGASLTEACDADVERTCSSEDAKEINGAVIALYGQCLLSQEQSKLDEGCKQLVTVVKKDGAYVGGVIDQQQLQETLDKLHELQASGPSAALSSQWLVLTGWTAFMAVVSLALVLIGLVYGVYWRLYGPHKNYTLVVKAGDV
eukprot:SM000105S13867  [mRNA]  locus=s105:179263:185692:- [translate_table: standard]